MIVSPAKLEDMRWRLKLLSEMETDLKEGRPITARELGRMTSWLANRIKTHDYSKEDAALKRLSPPPLQSARPRASI
tara:strand:+ start:2173 stop:2403 length:231 start_codon:yes stop_codon:yes gene_type:complete